MEQKIYKNLVLEGGGVLGIAYAGALEELEKRGILKQIVNYSGASIGAIVAGVLACGADSSYITAVMKTVDFVKFADYGSKIKAAYNTVVHKGACPGDYFIEWYGNVIENLTGNGDITLKQIYDQKGVKIVISVVNISQRRLELWDHKNKPDISLVKAVRASMSVPGIFEPFEIDGDLYIDGGTLCNYPICAFHYSNDKGDFINPFTIGLMLMSNSELVPVYPKITSLPEYAIAIVECIQKQPQKLHIKEQDWERTIKIPTGDVSSVNFYISECEKNKLIESGRKAVSDYFDGIQTYKENFKILKSGHTKEEE